MPPSSHWHHRLVAEHSLGKGRNECLRVSATVIKPMTKSNLRREGIHFIFQLVVHYLGSQRKSRQNTWPTRGATYRLDLLSLLSYTPQGHLSKGGNTHCCGGYASTNQSLIKKMLHRLPAGCCSGGILNGVPFSEIT